MRRRIREEVKVRDGGSRTRGRGKSGFVGCRGLEDEVERAQLQEDESTR